ncbi:DNA internalization-related competence protein ComEC/Rec2 [Thiocystis violascens]|uniref:DNA internalization-related competence protein ComEC/Rec2 n=1 Tax=Thiocystis violascens (strain ATCC 17096 / DSM 198 / 6111) TaxID=765911 RepID=I3Y706_THIV6|nr:DNA internalization-related competence protein ComEC/Rec2 [Thiocystis violascens]AFL72774.1 DNA internalization-related competence protein ComEC/Rec2 [Thiocystis violascens DSM 198]
MVAGLIFGAGVAAFYLLPALPSLWLALAALALMALAWRLRWLRPPCVFLLGIGWAQWHTCALLCQPFPDDLARAPLVLEGRIAAIPAETGVATRFLFQVERTVQDGRPVPFDGLVRLSWYQGVPALKAGERWRLPVRLKPRHGYANPGGFDFERWLFEQGVKATGHVRRSEDLERLDAGAGPYWLDRWRQRLAGHLAGILGEARALGLIQALTIGERAGLGPDDWEVLTRTGTNHLVAISGLHVGLVAAGVLFLTRWLWSLSTRLPLVLAAPRAGALAGALAALGYAALAGFAVSTQRALVMLAVVLGAVFWMRTLRPYHALTLALVAVLALDPRAVLSYGFWLSFGAVAVLLFHLGQRLPTRDLWTRWGRAQWAVGIGLLPLLFFLFGRASLIAPPVNLVAVPLFGLLLPLVLLASLLSLIPGFAWPLTLIAELLGWCLDGLAWLATQPGAMATLPARPLWAWGVAIAGVLLLLAPRGLPGRWLGVVLFLPLVWLRPPVPVHGEVWFTLLDVGQGLAAVARTGEGVLVFDTGPGFNSGFNTGSAVVAPFLLAQGIDRIDRLVVSHADRDHAGGLAGLAERVMIDRLQSGEPADLDLPGATPCYAGESWIWSGVSFRFLHPEQGGETGNNASCVLRIETGGHAILLAGDVEQRVERQLAARLGSALRCEILIAGHHGSATSSSAEFLRAVAPDLVLFSAGYANHFGCPARTVRERVTGQGIGMLNTAVEGAIEIRLGVDGILVGPRGWREQAGLLWTHRPGG